MVSKSSIKRIELMGSSQSINQPKGNSINARACSIRELV